MNVVSQADLVRDLQRRPRDAQIDNPSADSEETRPPQAGSFLCQVAGLDCRVYSNLSEVASCWRTLEKSSWLTPFQQYFWNASLCSTHVGDHRITPLIVVGLDSGVPKLLLPFAIERRWFSRRLVWLGRRVNDYNAPVIGNRQSPFLPDDAFTRIVGRIKTTYSIDALHLIRGPVDSGLPRLHLPGVRNIDAEYASHVIDLSRDWNQTYRQLRSSRSRQRLRGKLNALRQRGRVSFRKLRNPVEKSQLAHQILAWKSAQLDRIGKTNPFRASGSGLSHTIFAAINYPGGNLDVFGLFLDGVMIAGMIAFVDSSCFSLFVTAYAPNGPTNCSPGIILLVKTLELSSRAGLDTYDLLIGDEAYKLEWSKRTVPIRHHLHAFNLRGAIFCLGERSRLRLKKWLLARPSAMTLMRSLNKTRIHASEDFLRPDIIQMRNVSWPPR